MNQEQAIAKLVDAHGVMLAALDTLTTAQGNEIANLYAITDALSKMAQSQTDVVNALQASFDEQLTTMTARVVALESPAIFRKLV